MTTSTTMTTSTITTTSTTGTIHTSIKSLGMQLVDISKYIYWAENTAGGEVTVTAGILAAGAVAA